MGVGHAEEAQGTSFDAHVSFLKRCLPPHMTSASLSPVELPLQPVHGRSSPGGNLTRYSLLLSSAIPSCEGMHGSLAKKNGIEGAITHHLIGLVQAQEFP